MISNILALAIVFLATFLLASGAAEEHLANQSSLTRKRYRLFSVSLGDLEEAVADEDFIIRYPSTESSPIPGSPHSDGENSYGYRFLNDVTDSEEYVRFSPTQSTLTDASFDSFEVRFNNFMAAIGSGNVEQVKALLQNVGTPTTAFCNAPLRLAQATGNQEIVDLLSKEPTVIWSLNASVFDEEKI